MAELDGKVALVTGGTRGLGRATAMGLARMGARLALNYRRDEASATKTLEEVAAIASGSILTKADLEDDAQVREMVRDTVQRLGRLDILIANAAATAFKPLLQAKPHNLNRTFNLSVGGFVAAVQEAHHHMKPGGRIVMISGIDSVRFLPGHGILGGAKAALESMVRYSPSNRAHAKSPSTRSIWELWIRSLRGFISATTLSARRAPRLNGRRSSGCQAWTRLPRSPA